MLLRLILVIKNKDLEAFLKEYFTESDVWVESIGHVKNPFQRALWTSGDIFVIDARFMPKPMESALAVFNDLPESPTTIVLHQNNSAEEHAELVTLGADVVLYANLPKKSLAEAIKSTIDSRLQLMQRGLLERRTDQKTKLSSFVSESPRMKIFLEMLQKVIPCNTPVLLLGETGVGKEHLARIIHYEGPRATGPFIAVNCAALPETLLESELFGHEKGAFTGAVRPRRGAFELAHGGTIFLDEIAELPPHMQVKLLRVLQEYEIRPLGSEKSMWVDIRVIAATNRDIEQSIKEGSFRQDLYYRLSVFTLLVPSLRERQEDIPLIAYRYLTDFCRKLNKRIERISEDALKALVQYAWPGNVRELINVIERATILCQGNTLTEDDLPEGMSKYVSNRLLPNALGEIIVSQWLNKTLPEIRTQVLEEVERTYLEMVLAETKGRVGIAAKRAGIHPRGFYDKMKKYGLNKDDFKQKQ